jgi:NDP-sugar pyrophosphorylase family protein
MIASTQHTQFEGQTASAIVLAGTHVWQPNSFESLCPRVLLPLANQPLIVYLLQATRAAGLATVTLCTNDASGHLQAYLLDGSAQQLDLYYYQDRLPRGPAGCARDAAQFQVSDHYLVLDGSIVPTLDLGAALREHVRAGAAATVVVNAANEQEGAFGSHQSPTGAYVFSRGALEQVRSTGYQDIKEVLIPQLYADGLDVRTHVATAPVQRVYGLASYLSVQKWAVQRVRDTAAESGYARTGEALVHGTAQVSPTARVLGSVMIGPDCVVEEDAVITGPTVLGGGSVIGQGAAVSRSVLWDCASVDAGARVDQCLVTSGVAIQAGSVRHGAICSFEGRERRGKWRSWQTDAEVNGANVS